jgi:uncharacterized protein
MASEPIIGIPNSHDLDVAGAVAHATMLLHKLSPKLTYHNYAHTVEEVVGAADRLAAAERVGNAERALLHTAAYFHDLGFLETWRGHEAVSARIAGESLPHFGYAPVQIECVQALIMATQLPNHPTTLLECIIADADLDTLGRDDFWTRNRALRDELVYFGVTYTDKAWYEHQVEFIGGHRYRTASARALRDHRKAGYLTEIKARLAALQPD